MTKVDASDRTMLLERLIAAPVAVVWSAWMNPETLPKWWGPDGYSCRTSRIDLREGGEWVFDMIGPDGTVFPNHHRYRRVTLHKRIEYDLLWGENGPKHADATIEFDDLGTKTRVRLRMVMASAEEYAEAKRFGAVELGLQTLGKLARFVGAQ
ncbi:MAG: SRPBCC domain-containing protein [Rhodobacteraceae bacterium]|nr:SRPBCC domain-containing protein [Paracoccaceae bacterium]